MKLKCMPVNAYPPYVLFKTTNNKQITTCISQEEDFYSLKDNKKPQQIIPCPHLNQNGAGGRLPSYYYISRSVDHCQCPSLFAAGTEEGSDLHLWSDLELFLGSGHINWS
jgi:hypothetical protein